jgi:hypothetical protein
MGYALLVCIRTFLLLKVAPMGHSVLVASLGTDLALAMPGPTGARASLPGQSAGDRADG